MAHLQIPARPISDDLAWYFNDRAGWSCLGVPGRFIASGANFQRQF